MSTGSIRERSPFGSFYRSSFGSFGGAGKTLFRADGVGTASGSISMVGSFFATNTSASVWTRVDEPYNVPFGADSWGNVQPTAIGKSKGGSDRQGNFKTTRRRSGYVIPIPAGLTGTATATAKIYMQNLNSGNESWVPKLVVTTSDISGFPSGWWNRIGTACGGMVQLNNASQTISIPGISSYTGANMCFILGNSLEIVNGGINGGSGSFEYNNGTGNNLTLTITP